MTPLEITQKYVALSNNGQIDLIANLLDIDSTYSSENVGMHYGKEAILQMKIKFFSGLSKYHWKVSEYKQTTEQIIHFKFEFTGSDLNGLEIKRSGIETVIVNYQGNIQHIEVKNLPLAVPSK